MNKQELPGLIDAASAYGTGGGTPTGGAYEKYIAKPETAAWSTLAGKGRKVIPTVSAGWDNRPRANGTCDWCGNFSNPAYVIDPTMQELEDHTVEGLKWVQDNIKGGSGAAETNTMLLSAWNEHDEGHWIEPALEKYGGAEKLKAISRAIGRAEARAAAISEQ